MPQATDITSVRGLTVENDGVCRCGSTTTTIGDGAGPHAASLRCTMCSRHRGWLPERIVAGLVEVTIRFGRPSVTIRAKEHIAASSGADAAMFLQPRAQSEKGTEQVTDQVTDTALSEADLDKLYGSQYFGGADFPKQKTMELVIAKVEKREFRQADGTKERKATLAFHGSDKSLPLNSTNVRTMIEEFGRDPSKWVGATVALYGEQTSMGRGVRIRPAEPDA
jgi:hypothetical protein